MSIKSILQFNMAHRWIVLGFFILVTVLAATQFPKLRFEFSPEAMLEFSDEEIEFQHQFNEKFNTNPNLFLIVMSHPDGMLSAQSLTALRDLTNELDAIEGISGTYSLSRVPDNNSASAGSLLTGKLSPMIPADGEIDDDVVANVRRNIENSNVLNGNLISKNNTYTLILAPIDEKYSDPAAFYPVFEDIDEHMSRWKQQSGHESFGIDYGGVPYIRAEIVDKMKTEQFILWPVVGILYIIALCFVFKSFWQAIMPLICIVCVILWAIAIMVLVDMPVTMINNTLPLLILVIGVTNGIYVLMRIIDERHKGLDKPSAIVNGVSLVALATFLTTLTTSIGFGSLLTAKTQILNGFGGITSLAVMLTYVALIIMMPQVASLLPLRVDAEKHKEQEHVEDGFVERLVEKMTMFNTNHKYLVIIAAFLVLGGSLALASQVRFDSKVNDVFMDDHPIAMTNTIIEKHLGGMLPVEMDIQAEGEGYFRNVDNLGVFCKFQETVANMDGVISTLSLCSMLREAGIDWMGDTVPTQMDLSGRLFGIRRFQPEMFKSYITEDGSNVRLTLRIPDNGYTHAKKTIAQVQELARQTFAENIQIRLTGVGYSATLGLDHFMDDLGFSLLTAFLIILGILFISFRSFFSGLVAILPNLLPISMTLAVLPLLGFNLNTTSVLVFTISIGLSVDNSIHIIQRFRQEYYGERTVRESLIIAMKSSGRAILKSNILLCAGLAVLLFSTFDPVKRVGALTIITIAVALVASVIILPAEIICVGRFMRLPKYAKQLKEVTKEDTSESTAQTVLNDTDAVVSQDLDNQKKFEEAVDDSTAQPIGTKKISFNIIKIKYLNYMRMKHLKKIIPQKRVTQTDN